MFQVTLTERTPQDNRELEGAWTRSGDEGLNDLGDFDRNGSDKSLSKSKRVKSFIRRKCRNLSTSFVGSSRDDGSAGARVTQTGVPRSKSTSRECTTSWYVENDYHSDEEGTAGNAATPTDLPRSRSTSRECSTSCTLAKDYYSDEELATDIVDSRDEGGTGERPRASESDDEPCYLARQVTGDGTSDQIPNGNSLFVECIGKELVPFPGTNPTTEVCIDFN